jgi:hypothetical protein
VNYPRRSRYCVAISNETPKSRANARATFPQLRLVSVIFHRLDLVLFRVSFPWTVWLLADEKPGR